MMYKLRTRLRKVTRHKAVPGLVMIWGVTTLGLKGKEREVIGPERVLVWREPPSVATFSGDTQPLQRVMEGEYML